MENLRALLRRNAALRFLLGAGTGLAVSIPLFTGVEDWPVRAGLMLAFGAVFGIGSSQWTGQAAPRSRLVLVPLVVGVAVLVTVIAWLLAAR